MLFAAPWIISILRRPRGLPIAGWLFAGYLPLCLLLGLGWFFFSSHLTHDGAALATGTSSAADSLTLMGSAFSLPSSTIFLARLIGFAKIWVWAVPGMVLLAGFGAWKWRDNTPCLLLTASALTTLLLYVFVPLDQGHGWGYRYFHSAWIALPILAAGALTPRPVTEHSGAPVAVHGVRQIFEDNATRAFVVVCALLTMVGGTGLRAMEIHGFVAHHESQMPQYAGAERRVVIIDTTYSYYGADLVQNDPWLRGNVIRMFSHGLDADAQMMREQFPDLRRVYADRYGSVWSAGATNAAGAPTSISRP
jgi:hypothetical protein